MTAFGVPPSPGGRRSRRRWWLLTVSAVAAGAAVGMALARVAQPGPVRQAASGQLGVAATGTFDHGNDHTAPGWQLPSLGDPNRKVTLAQFGSGPVVINFWASWCPPCRKEMPALAAAARQFTGRVAFVGIDTSDDRNAAVAFAAHSSVSYQLGFDPQASVAGNYGVFGLPTTYFLAGGKIVGRETGGMSQARLDQLLGQNYPLLAATVTP